MVYFGMGNSMHLVNKKLMALNSINRGHYTSNDGYWDGPAFIGVGIIEIVARVV